MSDPQRSKRLRRIRLRLLAIDPRCFYCGGPLTVRWSTLDHVTPRSEGGPDEEWNLLLACQRCNGRKGNLPIEMVVVQRYRGCGLLAHKHLLRLREQAAG
jgi:5-methylcytosine-specific restriction endonuclease McrA